MKKFVIALMLISLVAGVAMGKEKTKENEPSRIAIDCSTATPISCGDVVTGTNVGGDMLIDAYGCGFTNQTGPEVFYTLHLENDAEVICALSGMSADLDIFFGVCGDDLDCLTSGDYGFSFDATAGDYYIAIDGYNGSESEFTLTVECNEILPPQPGETCDTAMTLIDDDMVNSCPGAEFWYVFTAPFDGFVGLDTCIEGQEVDTQIRVYDACNGNQIGYSDDDGECDYSLASYLEVPVEAGQVLYILFDDTWTSNPFDFDLFVSNGTVATDVTTFDSLKSMYR